MAVTDFAAGRAEEMPVYPRHAAVISWIFFDWAAQPYFTLITTFVFAPYFATHVASDPAEGQALWGLATAAAGLMIALMSPVLGAITDASGRRKPWIAAFGALLVLGSCSMWFARPGDASVIPLLLLAYAVATIGVEFATVFNNAMMPTLVPPERIGSLSGTGWATGYAGGILSLILVLGFCAANPGTGRTLFGLMPLFGLDPVTHQGDRITGPLTGIWFIIFVLPMFLLTPDYPARLPAREALRAGLVELRQTLAELPKQRSMAAFLLANMIYTDGLVSLFAFGGIYAAGTFGWQTLQIGSFGIILAKEGGALPTMMKPFKFGLGGKLGDGHQWMSWVALQDVVSIIQRALQDGSLAGPFNVVAPEPIRNVDFTKALGEVLHRPAILPAPKFALDLAMGEMADEALLASQRMVPEALQRQGYKFLYRDLRATLQSLLK